MINEEINKIKYLFGYKPGVVISEQTTPPTTGATPTTPPPTTGDTETKKISQKEIDNMRDCANYKSGGKLTKGEEVDGFIIFNGADGKTACKKPKEKK